MSAPAHVANVRGDRRAVCGLLIPLEERLHHHHAPPGICPGCLLGLMRGAMRRREYTSVLGLARWHAGELTCEMRDIAERARRAAAAHVAGECKCAQCAARAARLARRAD